MGADGSVPGLGGTSLGPLWGQAAVQATRPLPVQGPQSPHCGWDHPRRQAGWLHTTGLTGRVQCGAPTFLERGGPWASVSRLRTWARGGRGPSGQLSPSGDPAPKRARTGAPLPQTPPRLPPGPTRRCLVPLTPRRRGGLAAAPVSALAEQEQRRGGEGLGPRAGSGARPCREGGGAGSVRQASAAGGAAGLGEGWRGRRGRGRGAVVPRVASGMGRPERGGSARAPPARPDPGSPLPPSRICSDAGVMTRTVKPEVSGT